MEILLKFWPIAAALGWLLLIWIGAGFYVCRQYTGTWNGLRYIFDYMIDPWLYELRKERRERIKIVKKFLRINPGDGKHLRYHGAYAMPDGQGYYVYHIIDDSLEGCKTGIEHYALVDPINYSCRKATPDEALSLMMNELSLLIID